MGTLNRGAPIDVQFINDLVNTVDNLVAASNTSPYQQMSINNPMFGQAGMKMVKTAESRIHAETYAFAQRQFSANTAVRFSIPLTNFAAPPVVTASPVVLNTSASNYALSVTITSVSSTAVNGTVYFHTEVKDQTVGISMLAIGVPAASSGTVGTNVRTNEFYNTPPAVAN